ncbi:vWA domain-containing protein [Paenibacillus sp. FA6]|uniref:vWA domain-containing protein n=1 Tax=Paenibacillus sp. FA6 TaxID=3413029 RepID=UPI003F65AF33
MKMLARTICLFFGFILIVPPTIFAEAPVKGTRGKAFDAVFVLDTSYSMSTSDKDRISADVIQLFMDMSEASRTRVGFVAYNDRIVASQPLTSIAVVEKKKELKQKINQLKRSGYTDLGLGLLKGANVLATGSSEPSSQGHDRLPFLILLSDGETSFGNTSGGRTKQDSARDVTAAITKANKNGFPIYTIGLNHDGTVNQNELEQIASQTGGASFMTSSADDLPEIFNQIFAREMRSVLVPIAGITATGNLQEVKVNLPNSSMEEANIILLSDHPLKETQMYFNSENTRLFKSDKYSLMKISNPPQGTVVLKFKGQQGDWVKINLLGSYNLEAEVKLSDDKPIKGIPTGFEAYLSTPEATTMLKDDAVYTTLKAELVVKEVDSNEEQRIPMTNTGKGFQTDYTFPNSGGYAWKVMVDGPDFYRESSSSEVSITNLPPQITGSLDLEFIKEDGEVKLDLAQYIQDPNQDLITYSLQGTVEDKLSSELLGSTLTLTPKRTGQSELSIVATDLEGGAVTALFHVSIQSKYTLHKIISAAVAVILITGILLYFWLRPKPEFAGKLEGYFLNTASGTDIPVKSWPLTSFPGRQITLMQLFRSLDVNESLPESEHIVFEPGKNGILFVRHHTRCAVVHGKLPLSRNKKEALQFNDKLYITFEDGKTELELRYKAVKPVTTIYTGNDNQHSA